MVGLFSVFGRNVFPVLQHLCIDVEDRFFGQVVDVVAGAFQLAEDTGNFQTQTDGFRVLAGVCRQGIQGVLVKLVEVSSLSNTDLASPMSCFWSDSYVVFSMDSTMSNIS